MQKSSLHTQAGIQEYWILNRQLEVYRQPNAGQSATPSYQTHEVKTAKETIIPHRGPQPPIAVVDLLP